MRDVSPIDAPAFGGTIRPSSPADLQATADFDRLLWTHLGRSPSFSGLDVGAQDFESEWSDLWNEQEFPYHRLAELDGRVVGHILLYDRPSGDLRVPEQNIDLAHAATLEDARGTGAMVALTAGAIDWAREQGYRSFTTDWRVVNLEASRYWPRQGFRPTFYRLVRAVPRSRYADRFDDRSSSASRRSRSPSSPAPPSRTSSRRASTRDAAPASSPHSGSRAAASSTLRPPRSACRR